MAVSRTVEEMQMDLGEKLKQLRLNKNLDQKTLASQAGVSVRALRNLEGGAGSTLATLVSVTRALGRESWLNTVAPVATINPLTLTTRASRRQRASGKNNRPPATQPNPKKPPLLALKMDGSITQTNPRKKNSGQQ